MVLICPCCVLGCRSFLFIFWLFFLTYLFASISPGYLIAKWCFNVDLRNHGSGSVGATNVARVLGDKKYFFLVFFLDFIKSYLFLFFCEKIFVIIGIYDFYIWYSLIITSVVLLIGNGYSIFLRFRGGKGVATMLGILAYLFPILLVSFLLVWLLIFAIGKRVDIASLSGVLSIIPAYFIFYEPSTFVTILFLFFSVGWIVVRHVENLKKLTKVR